MRAVATAAVAVAIGCGPPPARHPAPAPARAEQPPPAAAGCTLDGTYRFRFRSNGHDGWWFRVKVAGATATMLEAVDMLDLPVGPIEVSRNPKDCTLEFHATTTAAGDLTVDLALDPRTNDFTGSLTRTHVLVAEDEQAAFRGVRDDGPPHSDATCIVPGIYELRFDPSVAWVNEDRDDERDCSAAPDLASPLFVRVEPFGDDVAVTMREPQPPYAEMWADSSLTRVDPCTAVVDLGDGSTSATLQLTFSGNEIAGTATTTSYQIVEDGTEGENIWTCVGANIPFSGHRVH